MNVMHCIDTTHKKTLEKVANTTNNDQWLYDNWGGSKLTNEICILVNFLSRRMATLLPIVYWLASFNLSAQPWQLTLLMLTTHSGYSNETRNVKHITSWWKIVTGLALVQIYISHYYFNLYWPMSACFWWRCKVTGQRTFQCTRFTINWLSDRISMGSAYCNIPRLCECEAGIMHRISFQFPSPGSVACIYWRIRVQAQRSWSGKVNFFFSFGVCLTLSAYS